LGPRRPALGLLRRREAHEDQHDPRPPL
jgi:hypothetical protein